MTDENFSKKMVDFIKHDRFEVRDIPLMKFGRHLRLSDGAKLVVGRNKEENEHLQNIDNDKYFHIKTVGIPGPHAMLSKNASEADRELSAKVILTYTKASTDKSYTLSYDEQETQSSPLASREEIQAYSIF